MSHYPTESTPLSRWAAGAEGAALALPLTLGAVIILYTQVAPEWLGQGVLASCLALMLIHFLMARSRRPMAFVARYFEAITMATMVANLAKQAPSWGMDNDVTLRMTLLVVLGVLAALWFTAFWLLHADRLVRFIPAPVFAGYVVSGSLAVISSQSISLWHMMHDAHHHAVAALLVALLTVCVCTWVHWKRPNWPATAIGLLAGSVLGIVLNAAQLPLEHLSVGLSSNAWTSSQWGSVALLESVIRHHPQVMLSLLGYGAVLGLLLFMNTVVTGVLLSQVDAAPKMSVPDRLVLGGVLLGGALAGAAPQSGASGLSKTMLRRAPFSIQTMLYMSVLVLLVFVSGLLSWIPMAALVGAFMFDAATTVDVGLFKNAWAWLKRRALPDYKKQDLILIGVVALSYLSINILAAMAVGLVLGLLLHAHRNTRSPIRSHINASGIRSNCARSLQEYKVLDEYGHDVQVFVLDNNQFFASAEMLQAHITQGMSHAHTGIVDWSQVRNIDSSIGLAMGQLSHVLKRQGRQLIHAGASLNTPEIEALLKEELHGESFFLNLDWALEHAENALITQHCPAASLEPLRPAQVSLLARLTQADRAQVIEQMQWRQFPPGECIFKQGAPSDSLVVLLSGQVSIMLSRPPLPDLRIAGARIGSTVGEVGFLDKAQRSASVIAETEVSVGVLTRHAFDALSSQCPNAVQIMLTNISLDIALRLRHSNSNILTQHN